MAELEEPIGGAEKVPLPEVFRAYLEGPFLSRYESISREVAKQIEQVERDRQRNTLQFTDALSFLMNNFDDLFLGGKKAGLMGFSPDWRDEKLADWDITDPMPEGVVTLGDLYDAFDRNMEANCGVREKYDELVRENREGVRAEIRKLLFPTFLGMAEEGFPIKVIRA